MTPSKAPALWPDIQDTAVALSCAAVIFFVAGMAFGFGIWVYFLIAGAFMGG